MVQHDTLNRWYSSTHMHINNITKLNKQNNYLWLENSLRKSLKTEFELVNDIIFALIQNNNDFSIFMYIISYF